MVRTNILGAVVAAGILTIGGCNERNERAPAPPSAAATASPSAAGAAAVPEKSGANAGADLQAPAPPASAGAHAAEAPAGPFNVVLISIDSLRADMPWAGYPREIAPRLTALEKKAIAYTNAYSLSSFTSKSLGGLLGGKYPSELTRTGVFFTRYLGENKMFCEALGEQGVPCVAGHAHMYLNKGMSGFEQGFAQWKLVPGITFDPQTDPYVTSQKLTPLAIEMLSDPALTSKPFLAWFHYMDPHEKYQPHPEGPSFGRKTNRDIYDEEVFYTDLWIGKLLDWIETQPWSKRTVIVVTADHGEAFGEHGLRRHATEIYEVLVHVPLFFIVPGQEGRHIDATRSHIDLVPTMMELLGAKPNPELSGKSFRAELFGAPAEPRDVICDLPKDDFNERHRSILHDGWKLIAFGNDVRYELYDVRNDPGEQNDLFRKEKDKAKEMLERYKEASARIVEGAVPGGIPKH